MHIYIYAYVCVCVFVCRVSCLYLHEMIFSLEHTKHYLEFKLHIYKDSVCSWNWTFFIFLFLYFVLFFFFVFFNFYMYYYNMQCIYLLISFLFLCLSTFSYFLFYVTYRMYFMLYKICQDVKDCHISNKIEDLDLKRHWF